MKEDRITWLRAARQASSFRQMYALASNIVQSGAATDADRFAAQRVINALSDIIDKPIAKASRLAKARRRFGALVKALCGKGGIRPSAGPSVRRAPVVAAE